VTKYLAQVDQLENVSFSVSGFSAFYTDAKEHAGNTETISHLRMCVWEYENVNFSPQNNFSFDYEATRR